MDLRFPLLLACFFLSGFAALLYQTAWSRELSFVFGTSDLAVAAVLAAYMGGLALGAAGAARLAHRLRRPVLAYGVLELAIAGCALLVPAGIAGIRSVYVGLLGGLEAMPDGGSTTATIVQLIGTFVVLLPPTAFMGATLPLLARHAVHRDEEIATRVGLLYAINTTGAIAGTLLAAFWLMPELGLRRTVWVGAALNAAVFVLAWLLARSAPVEPSAPADRSQRISADGAFWVLPAMLLSGAVSFAYEVLWTRLLGHLLGASLHAFATMLASFLLGIAVGSAIAARLASTRERAIVGFAASQLGIALTSWGVFSLADQLPALSLRLGAGPANPLASAAVAGAALLPITLCIGATFPFAVRILARDPADAAASTARVYAWNTIGAIVGALGAGFVLLPRLGFEGQVAINVACSLALAAWAALSAAPRRIPIAAAAAAVGIALLALPMQPPWTLLSSSPMRTGPMPQREVAYFGVGRTTTVVLFEHDGRYQITTGGLPEAWIDPRGMLPEINVAQWLGALPAIVRPESRDMLVIGLGGGVALEFIPSSIEHVDVVEIEPEVVAANRSVGGDRARDPLSDPRITVHIGDARGALQLLGRSYDAIVSQPSHPWTAGASHLYTREFFSLARSRLSPDGVFVQWIGINFVDEALLGTLIGGLTEAFPHVNVFQPQTHGLLFVGSMAPLRPLEGARRAIRDPSVQKLGLNVLGDFASAWVLDSEGSRTFAKGAPPNTDDHNLLASRSSRLEETRLDPPTLRSALAPLDPLVGRGDLDRSQLVRSLLRRGQTARANDLAGDGPDAEAARGWIELASNRPVRASQHFARALERSPQDDDARSGLIASRKGDFARLGLESPLLSGSLNAREAALIDGWHSAATADWEAVAAHDADLARYEPGHGLYETATRMRIAWRLETQDPAAADEARLMAEALLRLTWNPFDALHHAQAALQGGHPLEAWGSLRRVPQRTTPQWRGFIERAQALAAQLPSDDPRYEDLRRDLARRAEGMRRAQAASPVRGLPAQP